MAGSQTFRSLKNRNARWFLPAVLISNIGTWVQMTATALLVKRLAEDSQDGRVLGVTIGLQFLPMLLIGAWAGGFADQRNRRRMAIVTQSLFAVQAFVLAAVDFAGRATIPVVYVLAFVLGIINAMDNPARRGLLTELVEPDDIANAMSLNTAVMTGSRIFGPALAAWLVHEVGTAWCFLVNGVSFAAILFSLLTLDRSLMHPPRPAPRGGTPVRDGLRLVWHTPRLRVVYAVMVIVSTFAFNYSVTFPMIAGDRFGDDNLYGPLLTALSVGSVIGSLLVASRRDVRMRWLLGSCVGLGAAGISLAWAPNRPVAFALSVPLGIFGAMYVTSANAISQSLCPPPMRSRLLALGAVAFLGSTPIGSPITGWIGDKVSAEWSLAYGGVISILCAFAAAAYLRRATTITADSVDVSAALAERESVA